MYLFSHRFRRRHTTSTTPVGSDAAPSKNVVTIESDFLGLERTVKYGDYASPARSLAQGYDKPFLDIYLDWYRMN
jgi:hypothetical protein